MPRRSGLEIGLCQHNPFSGHRLDSGIRNGSSAWQRARNRLCQHILFSNASPPGQRCNKWIFRVAAGPKSPVSTYPHFRLHRLDSGIISRSSAWRRVTRCLCQHIPRSDVHYWLPTCLSSHNAGVLQPGRILAMVVVAVTFGNNEGCAALPGLECCHQFL